MKQSKGSHKERKADVLVFAERKPLASSGTANTMVSSTGNPIQPSQISFNRQELTALLRIYGFKVADGEWRDYAIDHLPHYAVFSVFRRASESPLYRVVKNPKLSRKQGAYSVMGQNGAILRRGHDITQVLKVFEKQLKLVE